MSAFPQGWGEASLEELADINPGRVDGLSPGTNVSFVPMPAVSDIEGEIVSPTVRPFAEVSKGYTHFQQGDVIFAKITPCMENGKIAVARSLENGIACGSTEFHVVRPKEGVPAEYIWRFLRQKVFRENAERSMTGAVGQRRVPAPFLKESRLPVPPLPEQQRIAAKIGSLIGKSRRARENLDHIPRLVEKYKQAVLAAAFRGDLTRDVRGAANHDEEGTKGRAGPAQAASNTHQGKPNLAGFARYLPELPALPARWTWSALGEVSQIIDPNPSHRYPTYDGGAVPLLSTREFVGEDGWNVGTAPLVPDHVYDDQRQRCGFDPGDVIFARKGRLGLARRPPSIGKYAFSHTIFVIKPTPEVDQSYAIYLLRWDRSLDWLMMEMNSNTGVPTLGKATLQLLPIAVAPLHEQREIVRRIEITFAWIERLASEATNARKLIDHLDQAVLAKAFRGELVPQDPADEPASELLERIRASRGAATKSRRRERRAE